nr:inactive LRR receptor-like serine/threonine-protein kinase BIR2 [Ipomoea batatas]
MSFWRPTMVKTLLRPVRMYCDASHHIAGESRGCSPHKFGSIFRDVSQGSVNLEGNPTLQDLGSLFDLGMARIPAAEFLLQQKLLKRARLPRFGERRSTPTIAPTGQPQFWHQRHSPDRVRTCEGGASLFIEAGAGKRTVAHNGVAIFEGTASDDTRHYAQALFRRIPQQLGISTYLKVIDLHDNQLSGLIPPQLSLLVRLSVFDVSNNQLSAPIPASLGNRSGNLRQFNASSYKGNKDLYGYPLPPKKGNGLSILAIVGIG